MLADSASNHSLAVNECRRRLVATGKHRFALPGEPLPGWVHQPAAQPRANTAVLLAVIAALAIAYLAHDGPPELHPVVTAAGEF